MILAVQALLYALLGLVVENIFTGVGAAINGDPRAPTRSYLWMLPVWALGGLALHLVTPLIGHLTQYWARGLLWTATIYALEFFSGLLFLATIKVVPWKYDKGGALWGTINWHYLPFWLVMGMVVDPVQAWVRHLATLLVRG